MIDYINTYYYKNKEIIYNDLRCLLQIPSVSSDLHSVERALDYIINLGDKMGFRAAKFCNNRVGVIEVGDGDEIVGILTHVDVVPVGNHSDWRFPPFDMTIKNGNIYGRGALDDKGPVILCLHAMKAISELNCPLNKKIQLIIGTQEEVKWVDMDAYCASEKLPNYGFTPDGEYPICNIEKGIIDISVKFPNQTSKEDGWYITSVSGGIMPNGVPDSASATMELIVSGKPLQKKILKADGRAVHSSEPWKGENAIVKLAQLVSELDIRKNAFSNFFDWINLYFKDVYGKNLNLYNDSEYYNGEYVHRNTLAVTMVTTEKDTVNVLINVRYPYGETEERIFSAISKSAAPYGASSEIDNSLPAVFVSSKEPFIDALSEAYEEATGMKSQCTLAYGGSYAKAMPNIVSWGPLLPDDVDTCHEINEYISEKSFYRNFQIYALGIEKLALKDLQQRKE